jgi:plastin-1
LYSILPHAPTRIAKAGFTQFFPKERTAKMSGMLDRKYSEKSMKISGAAGAHTFSEEEKEAFSEHINHCLSEDPHLQHLLPLDSMSMDLFDKSTNGLIMCKLINLAQYDAIDERAMNKQLNMNVYQKTENQNLALNAAKAIGCQVINIGAQDLIEGNPILILGLVWQIIKIQLLSQISLKNVPELVLLLEDDETLADFLKLHPELILLRWLNYHLAKAGSARRVKNFGSDLSVSAAPFLSSLLSGFVSASFWFLVTDFCQTVRKLPMHSFILTCLG